MSMDDVIRQMREREELMRWLVEGPLGDPRSRELIFDRAHEAARALEMIDTNSIATALNHLAAPEFVQALESATRQASEFMKRLQSPESLAGIERFLTATAGRPARQRSPGFASLWPTTSTALSCALNSTRRWPSSSCSMPRNIWTNSRTSRTSTTGCCCGSR
jgi:hypothetical protein